jgi:hypothetical protein
MTFDAHRFRNPPASLRGAPFFSLNHDLRDHDRLREYIDSFAEMGIGGFHLHVRCGLKNPYMEKDFLEAVSAARDHAAEKGMLCYLYDEDTWPSGFAGGAVTTELTHRKRWVELRKGRPDTVESLYRQPLCAYRIELDATGHLLNSERISFEEGDGECWFLTRCIQENSDRFNGAAYLDTLSPAAVRAFIDSTHEVYLAHFGGTFPENVPAIFTDEPQMGINQPLVTPFEGTACFAWTDDLTESFATHYEIELLDVLPAVLWPAPEGPSVWRWRFRDHLAERFVGAFSDSLGSWCEAHGIALTGHLMREDNLSGQVYSVGECMRHYRSYQIPGIDLLSDAYLPATAKQAVSVARQDGRTAVLSELYGVTNWDFPFSGHKRQGDWQAALGITLRVHHLSWLSMEGQSKRDFPASMGPQSPWHREYPVIEDHFARVGAALTTGKPLVRIGVIHPVESAWLRLGVSQLDSAHTATLESEYKSLVNCLLDACLDFDFIAESLLPAQRGPESDAELQVGNMAYSVVVIPEVDTLRASTLEILEAFIHRGGEVRVLGRMPPRCDGAFSEAPARRLSGAELIPGDAGSVLSALEPWRELSVIHASGMPHSRVNHQLRQCGEERILFCSCREDRLLNTRPWAKADPQGYIRVRGTWRVRELHTEDGSESSCSFHQEGGWTVIPWEIQPQSHRLLRFLPGEGERRLPEKTWHFCGNVSEPSEVTREEPNVLLLDRAAWRLNDEDWCPSGDSLLIQKELADRFDWPDWGQPYSVKDPGPRQRVTRRFTVHCASEFQGVQLVCERINAASVRLDGQPIPSAPDGWWVDRDLPTLHLPPLTKGEHQLEVDLDLDAVDRYLEWCYLLGDFDVEARGAHARMVEKGPGIVWGDVVPQGLPFYGGNLEYLLHLRIQETGTYAIRCPNFGGHLLRVFCGERDCGPLAFAPYRVELGELPPGEHTVRIRAFGNRYNSFGALHNNRPDWGWWGPPSWYGDPDERNEAWQFKPAGILRAPMLERL